MPHLERLRALPARVKVLVAGLVVAACGAVALAVILGRDPSVPVFAQPLRPEQVAEVTERLAAWNVPFVALSDNVRVDPRRRNDVLLRLSMAGVPHAHVSTTAEALEKTGPLTPQSVLDAEQRVGLAGDLELALRGIAGIDDARVMLAVDHAGPMSDEPARPPTASVRLTLRPGTALGKDAVDGIRTFVASAVSGLDPARVAILDDRGSTLVGAERTDEAQQLQSSLQSALDAAFGVGASIVRVRVSYDARRREVREMRRQPLVGSAIVATRNEERIATDRRRYSRSSSSEDRGSVLRDEHIAIAPGTTERISVAVLVDAARSLDMEKIRDVAAATTGMQAQRGDTLSVDAVAFQRKTQLHASGSLLAEEARMYTPLALLLIGSLIAVKLIARPVSSTFAAIALRGTVRRLSTYADKGDAERLRTALSGEPPYAVAAVLAGAPAPMAAAILEAYDPDARAAIVRYMSRAPAPVARDAYALLSSEARPA